MRGVHRSFFSSSDVKYEKYEVDVLSPNYNGLYLRLLCEGQDLDGAIDSEQLSQSFRKRDASITPTLSTPAGGSDIHIQHKLSKHGMTRRNTLPLSRKPALSVKSKSVSEQHIVKSHEMVELRSVSSSMHGQTEGVLDEEGKPIPREHGEDADVLDFDMIPEDLEETERATLPHTQEETHTESHLSSEARSIHEDSDSDSPNSCVC